MAPKGKNQKSSRESFKDFLIAILLLLVLGQASYIARIHLKKSMKEQRKTIPPKPVHRTITKKSGTEPILPPSKPIKKLSKGKIAVIIDDSGYNIEDCQHLNSINHSVTISILPELPYSKSIAECAMKDRSEVMLHLPLEPHSTIDGYPRGYIISTKMTREEVTKRFQEALNSVPFTEGLNNHMGSKATENTQLMSTIFDLVKKNDLFFVDSRVTSKSICPALARNKMLPFAQRDIFLDNEENRAYIEGQFRSLARVAAAQGYAIGIGHAKGLTWAILKEQLDKLSAEGFEIVPVKSIIQEASHP